MKRAFTLIELLVVIAIIAILAAILFPVFAQAKAAAKKTASLSDCKQLTLAMIQYGANTGDNFPPSVGLGGRSVENRVTVNNGQWFRPWPTLIADFVKSDPMFDDPLAKAFTYPSGQSAAFKPMYSEINTSWGYNSVWLAPVSPDGNGGYTVATKSAAQLAQPAATVLMTSKWALADTSPALPFNSFYPLAGALLTTYGHIDPPDCYSIAQMCGDNWGKGSFYDNTLLNHVFENGAQTGGVSVRANGGTIVSFADGHAARMTLGALANGTTWAKDKSVNDVKVNDETKYLWDDK